MESLVLSPTSTNHDLLSNLIVISASPRNVIFNQIIRNYLISPSEVICLIDIPHPSPALPSKEGDLDRNNALFATVNFLVLPSPAYNKSFILYRSSELLSV